MLLQMALFHSFYGCVVFHCIYMYHIFFIHSSVDGHLVASMSGLWCIVTTCADKPALCKKKKRSHNLYHLLISAVTNLFSVLQKLNLFLTYLF